MKRVLFACPLSDALAGGGNALAMWILESLKSEYRITILNWFPLDFEKANLYYGTALRPSDFEMEVIEPWIARLASMSPTPMALLKDYYLSYRCRQIADRFDAVIWPANEGDIGGRGIQYIHYPRLLPDRPPVDLRWWHHVLAPAVRAYYVISARLTDFSVERVRQNLTLVNSDFIGRQVRKIHGISPITVYPPAIGKFPDVPWEKRKNGFVCIGRISPEKRFEMVIDVLSAVRRVEPDLHLHLVGGHPDTRYLASIKQLIQLNASWITFHNSIPRSELVELIAANRYGIHGMHEEHFGMAVAELVSGGCITFAPNSGGPIEILGGDARLLYDSPGDAVQKILRVLRDPNTCSSLRSYLATRRSLFGTRRFSDQIREVVRQFLDETPEHGISPLSSRSAAVDAGGN